jgi:hypothetical protein
MPFLGSIIKSAIELRNRLPLDSLKPKPHIAQKRTLKKLLKKASITAFGEHYNFSEILKEKNLITAFQQKIPLSDYNLIFRKWWYRSLNGEPFVCWPGKIKYFALSSGTSEASS